MPNLYEISAILDTFRPHCNADELYQTNFIFKSIVMELAAGGSMERNIVKLLGVIQMQAELNAKMAMEGTFPLMMTK